MDAAAQVRARCVVLHEAEVSIHRPIFCLWLTAAAVLLVACGGSDDPARGALIDFPLPLHAHRGADRRATASGLQAISGKAKCDVKVVSLNYATVGVRAAKTPTPRA